MLSSFAKDHSVSPDVELVAELCHAPAELNDEHREDLQSALTRLVRKHTAFMSWIDLTAPRPCYLPTFYVSGLPKSAVDEVTCLADCYDVAMAARGDRRRVHRADFRRTISRFLFAS